MKITKRQLRRIIREAVESQYYKDLKQRSAHRGEITRSVKDFSKIVIDQVEHLVSGIDVPFDPLEKRHSAFGTLTREIEKFYRKLDDTYDKEIRQPSIKRDAEENKRRKQSAPLIDEDSLSPESERYYMDHD